jgi:trk/ktr system potassium uptake protein
MSFTENKAVIFSIRPQVLLRYLCLMMGLFSILTCIPFGISLASGSATSSWAYFSIIVFSLFLGIYGYYATRNEKIRVQRNESLALVALLFISIPLLQSIPIMSYGIPFIDAWFEAVSGVTTTGLSTLDTIENRPISFLFARGWMQWVGGLGIIVLALALVFQPGIVTQQLGFDANEVDDVVGGTRAHARRVLIAYLLLTLVIVLLLLLAGSKMIDALVHAMAAISTGGFANYDDSLAGIPSVQRGIVMMGCLAGAISFHLYYRRQFADWNKIFGDVQFLFLIGVIFLITTLLFLTMSFLHTLDPIQRGEHALWMAISAQTTAGFATLPIQEMGNAALGILSISMFVGGGLGSTAGGIKLLRLLMLLRVFQLYLQRLAASSHARITDRFMGAPLTFGDIQGVIAVIVAYVMTLLVSWLIFLQYGYDPLEALFEVCSALGTAGLSAGLVGSELETSLKVVLIINMLMGRVEAIAIIFLLLPGNWFGKRRK